jgi:hypothetical protein
MFSHNIPDNFSIDAVAAIDARLHEICLQYGVSIPLADRPGRIQVNRGNPFRRSQS